MRALYVSIFATLITIFGVALAFRTATNGVTVTPQVLATTSVAIDPNQDIMINQINALRNGAGVLGLSYSSELKSLTDFRVQDMNDRDYYSHKTPEGYTYTNYMNEYDITSTYSCENLQLQSGSNLSEAVEAWHNSPAHYRCLVNPRVSKVAISYAVHGDVMYDSNNQPRQMYIFAFIASN